MTKDELLRRITELLNEFEVIGPQKLPAKGIFYKTIKSAEELYLGNEFAVEPIKKYFLSPSEWLFKENVESGHLEEITLPKNKRIIIGINPCEARGLTLLDKVFDSDTKDNFYINNRKRTIVVGKACDEPDEGSCFCTSLGGSPADTRGMDAILYEKDGGYVIESITEKGNEIFGYAGKELSADDVKYLDAYKEKLKSRVKRKIKAPESLEKTFASDYWYDVSLPCISCGVCTFLCPTCHCFDLVDEDRKKLRCYDGCAFSDFTLEASGGNPRPAKKERYRQRVFHKFDYFKRNFGENLCVGCGRCIRHCPVKIDIAEIVSGAK